MVTKDLFISALEPLMCSLCLEPYSTTHMPIQLPDCGHIFGDYCLVNAIETDIKNNNRCPLCRKELFEQEDFDEDGEYIYDDDDEETDEVEDLDDALGEELVKLPGEDSVSDDEPDTESEVLPRIAIDYHIRRSTLGLSIIPQNNLMERSNRLFGTPKPVDNQEVLARSGNDADEHEDEETDENNTEVLDSEPDDENEDNSSESDDSEAKPHVGPDYEPGDDNDSDNGLDDKRRAKVHPEELRPRT
jgi:hypothetical protein